MRGWSRSELTVDGSAINTDDAEQTLAEVVAAVRLLVGLALVGGPLLGGGLGHWGGDSQSGQGKGSDEAGELHFGRLFDIVCLKGLLKAFDCSSDCWIEKLMMDGMKGKLSCFLYTSGTLEGRLGRLGRW